MYGLILLIYDHFFLFNLGMATYWIYCSVISQRMLPRSFVTESEKRRRQIDTLKIFNDNVVEIKENAEYKVEFEAGNAVMSLDVILGAEFPYEKPILKVNPKIVHSWVAEDSTSIIGAPGLINYTIHSDLGRVVQAIIREFEQKPPKLLDESPVAKNDIDLNLNSQTAIVNSNVHTSPSFSVTSPVQSLIFPGLENLTIEELECLRENIDLQDKFLETIPQTIELNDSIKELMDEIELLAKENLSKQSLLDDIKKSIIERLDSVALLKNNYELLKNKHGKLSSMYTPHAIVTALATSTVSADEEAEHLADAFLQGNIDCDTFLRNYEIKRSLGHSRKACQERLSHQLSQFDKAA